MSESRGLGGARGKWIGGASKPGPEKEEEEEEEGLTCLFGPGLVWRGDRAPNQLLPNQLAGWRGGAAFVAAAGSCQW